MEYSGDGKDTEDRDGQNGRAKSVSLRNKCDRVVSHVFSTALNGSVSWSLSLERVMRVKRWESKNLRLTSRRRMKANEELVECTRRTSREVEAMCRKMNLPTMARKTAEKVWKTMRVTYDGDVLVMREATIDLEMDYSLVEEQECLGHED